MSRASRPHPLLQFSAGGLVVDERGSVLLIRARDLRNQPVWTLPKGALNPGESAADAALREVREETGWECEVVRELESVTYWFQRSGQRSTAAVAGRTDSQREVVHVSVPTMKRSGWRTKSARHSGSSVPSGATSVRSASSTQSIGDRSSSRPTVAAADDMPACAQRIRTPGYATSIFSTVVSSTWHCKNRLRDFASSAMRRTVGASTSSAPKCDSPMPR